MSGISARSLLPPSCPSSRGRGKAIGGREPPSCPVVLSRRDARGNEKMLSMLSVRLIRISEKHPDFSSSDEESARFDFSTRFREIFAMYEPSTPSRQCDV